MLSTTRSRTTHPRPTHAAVAPVRRRTRLLGAVVAAGLALALTGCGSTGPDPADVAAEVDHLEAIRSLDAVFATAEVPSAEELQAEHDARTAGTTAPDDPDHTDAGDPSGPDADSTDAAPRPPAAPLSVGDCLDHLPTGAEDTAADIPTADCAGEHLVEVYRAVTLAPLGPDYPLFTDVFEVTQEGCGNGFLEYVGGTVVETGVAFDAVTPSAESWSDGDTTALCYAYPVSLAPFTGTLQGFVA